MKKIVLLLGVSLAAWSARADLWTYDFGSGTYSLTSNSTITNALPQPTTGGGEDRIRVGLAGGGIYLENPGDVGVGSGSELRIQAPSTTAFNKFSIYDYTAADTFSVALTLKFTGGGSGLFGLFLGDGSTYSDNSGFNGAQVFTGIQFDFGSGGTITSRYRNATAWAGASTSLFAQDSVYNIEIYGNNNAASANYTRGTSQSLASGTWDLWVNGVLVSDNTVRAGLTAGSNIDSIMLYGGSSAGNTANVIVDDIVYANELVMVPEPGTAALMVLTGAALVLARRRRSS